MDRLDIIKDVASQRVYFYPPEGRPSTTPSVEIKDRTGTVITAAATTYVTEDAVNTTLSANAALGAKSVTLTSVADLEIDVEYLLTSTLSEVERVTVTSINTSSKAVGLADKLEHAFASTSTFVGTRFYRTLQTAEVDELAELYRARASYAVGGLNYIIETPFDVVLTPLSNLLTEKYVMSAKPGLRRQEHPETIGSAFASIRQNAWDEVRKGVRAEGEGDETRWRPALVRTGDDLDLWGLAVLDRLLHEAGVSVLPGDWGGAEALSTLEGRVARAKQRSIRGIRWLDLNEDDSFEQDEELPLELDMVR